MKCPNCEKEIENGSVFCEYCGTRIKKSKKGLWITLGVVCALILTAIVVGVVQKQQREKAKLEQAVLRAEQDRKASEESERLRLEAQLEAARQAAEQAALQAEQARKATEEAERLRLETKLEAERQAAEQVALRAEQDRKASKEAERLRLEAQLEAARQAAEQAALQAEQARKAAAAAERRAELARQEAASKTVPEGYVDLGLPSGVLWKDANEGGDKVRYTYNKAVKKFGKQLPTKAQLEELEDKCTWTWTGNGYKVTGPNGNSIFLPAAGYSLYGLVDNAGTRGYYWSSTPRDSDREWYLYFYSGGLLMGDLDRSYGLSVRLVLN